MRLRSVPATRQVVVDDRGIVVTSVFAKTRDSGPWTVAPLPLPDGIEAKDLRVYAARATEWSTDLLVELVPSRQMEVWRLSPQRLRVRLEVPGVEPPPDSHSVSASTEGFHYALGQKEFTVVISDVPFDVEVSARYKSGHQFDFFISYRSNQRKVALALVNRLEGAGYRVWFDTEQLAVGNFDERIRRGIECSDSFVVLWSEGSGTAKVSASGTGGTMSQDREIDIIISELQSRRGSQLGDDNLAIYSVDGRKPSDELIDDRYQVTWAAEHSIEEFGDRVINWYRGRVKAGYR